jgi:hypothetical protein
MKVSQELVPCEFCKEAQNLQVVYKAGYHPNDFDDFYVRCGTCFARGPNIAVTSNDKDAHRQRAVDAWNNRPGEQSIRDDQREKDAGIAETYSWQDGKMTENSCCAATGCDIAAAIRQMKGEG